ncbi:MAG: SGNH/GDSL hydrolase family protein [Alphaproteobacteria bacterium]
MGTHLILLGDSVFDNAAYVLPGQADVAAHLNRKLARRGWSTDLRAVDGHMTFNIDRQVAQTPVPDGAIFVLSVGGNDALCHMDLLGDSTEDKSVATILATFHDIKEAFRGRYARALDAILAHGRPAIVCTIYNPKFPEPELQRLAETALSFFNDAITAEALARDLPIIDLRHVCADDAAFANPIEPSEIGGDAITDAIIAAVERLPEPD